MLPLISLVSRSSDDFVFKDTTMLKYILISFLTITNAYAYTCEEMGYTKSIADCPDGGLKCPAQPEKMFCCDPCGSSGAHHYTKDNCSPDDGLQLAGVECGGKWTECRQCTSEYKYTKDNCRRPKILAGVQCGNAYTQCVYPVNSGCVPTVGYIYYADDTCHSEYDNTKEAIGIIVDAANHIVLALDEKITSWNDGTDIWNIVDNLKEYKIKDEAIFDNDGKSNTGKIITSINKTGQNHHAADYCFSKKDGNKNWFLPALKQLIDINNRITDIQISLSLINNATSISTNVNS